MSIPLTSVFESRQDKFVPDEIHVLIIVQSEFTSLRKNANENAHAFWKERLKANIKLRRQEQ